MTLTEEQREAIRVISKLPMAIGCQLCHPYIMENYGSHFIVLRAMIDGSSMVEPGEGFDLEKARAVDIDLLATTDWGELRARYRAALAEIERLRPFEIAARDLDSDLTKIAGERDDQAARIKSLKKEIRRLKHESKVEQEFTNSYIKRLHDAEARIKELGSSLDEAETLTKKNAELMNGYLRRIAELEDALVEDLAADIAYDDRLLWSRLDGQRQDEYREKARQQLQAGGKIGNSEHFTDASKMIWHITEERKAALWHAIKVLKENDIMEEPEEHLWDEEVTVLQAMLTEAGQ